MTTSDICDIDCYGYVLYFMCIYLFMLKYHISNKYYYAFCFYFIFAKPSAMKDRTQ